MESIKYARSIINQNQSTEQYIKTKFNDQPKIIGWMCYKY